MKRLIVVLAVLFIFAACTDRAPYGDHAQPKRECRFHGALQENGYLYDAPELVGLTDRKDYPVWVYYGIPETHGNSFLLRVSNESDTAFVVLDLSAMPETALTYGLGPLVGWNTRVVGRYTSRDVADPSVPGAVGTLAAVSIRWLRDPNRPRGPYANLRAEEAEGIEKGKVGD